MADLFGSAHARAVMLSHGFADSSIGENASRDIILELDHHAERILPARPGEGILYTLERIDQRIEQPRVHQCAQHIAFIQVLPRPSHGRFFPDSLSMDGAIDHDRNVHGHALPCSSEHRTRGLQDTWRADTSCREDDSVCMRREGFSIQPTFDSNDMSILRQHTLDTRARAKITSRRDRLIYILCRAPLRMAATTQHAFRATIKLFSASRLHELELRFPVVS